MSVTVKGIGTWAAGLTPTPSPPSGGGAPAAGDRSILLVMVKPSTTTITDPTNWTKIGEITGGTGTQGIDTGPSKLAYYYRDGAFSGAQTISMSGTNSAAAIILTYQKTLGDWAAGTPVFDTGDDTTAGSAAYSTPAGQLSDQDATAGDALLCGIAIAGDGSLALGDPLASPTITYPGLTGGTTTSGYGESAVGQDIAAGWINREGFTGTATGSGAVSATFTGSPNASGPSVVIILRDQPAFTLQTNSWRLRNDDGSETGATWKAAEDTNPASVDMDTNFRVRFRAGDTAGVAGTWTTPQLQYNWASSGWTNATSVSGAVRVFASPHYADGDNTTEQLTGGGGGTFVAGEMDDSTGATVSISLGANGNSEVEFCVQIRSAHGVADGEIIELRVLNGGATISEGTGHPTFEANVGTGQQDITPAPVTVTVTPGTLTVRREEQIVPGTVTVSVTPGSLVISQPPPDQDITPAPVTVTASPGSLVITTTVGVTPAPVTVSVTPGSLVITPPPQDVTPAPVTVSVTPGSLSVVREEQVVPAPVTVAVTPGSLVVSQPAGQQDVTPAPVTVSVTPGSLSVAREEQVVPAPVTVSVTPGSLVVTPPPQDIVPAPVTVEVTPGRLAVMQAPVYRGHADTVIGGGGATTIDAAVPAGAANGELLVAVVSWRGIGTISATGGGWTERHDFPDSVGPQKAIYTRTAGASEPATYNFTFSGSASRVVSTIYRFSDHNGVEASTEASNNSTSPSMPSATSGGAGRLALYLLNHAQYPIYTPPSGEQIQVQFNTSSGAAGGVVTSFGYIEVVGSGATGARTGTFDGAQEWRGATLIITPAVAGQNVNPGAVTVTVTPGSLSVVREEQIVPGAVTVSVTPGSLSIVREEQVVPGVVTVTVTPGSLSLALNIIPAPVTVSVTPGSLGVVREEQVAPGAVVVSVTPGSLSLASSVTPAPVTVSVTPGSLSIAREEQVVPGAVTVSVAPGSLSISIGLTPAPVTVSVTPGSLSITTGPVDVIPDPVTVSVTPSDLTITQGLVVVPFATTVDVTPGSLSVAREEAVVPAPVTVSVTPGSLSVAREEQVVPGAVTVTVTAGSLTVSQLGGGDQAVTPAPVTVAVNVGSLSVVPDQAVTPDSTTVNVTPGGLVVTAGPVDITPASVTVVATPGTLTVIPDQAITPAAVIVTATPGNLLVAVDQAVTTTAPTVSVTPGTLTITVGDASVIPAPATVTVAPGVLVVTGGVFSVQDSEWDARLTQRWRAQLDRSATWWSG